MKNNYIFATKSELNDYFQNYQSKKINLFWKTIISELPPKIQNDLSTKLPTLVKQNIEKFNVIGANPYRFTVDDIDMRVIKHLDDYVVFVEDNQNKYLVP